MTEFNDNAWTPQEMHEWFQAETRGLAKAMELRIHDAFDFVSAYEQGKLSPSAAMDRLYRYESRWGEGPIPGVTLDDSMTNEDIIKELDRQRELRLSRKRRERGFER